MSGGRLGKIVFFLLMTPMIVPVILIAIGAFYVFGKMGIVNSIAWAGSGSHGIVCADREIIITSALRTYDLNQNGWRKVSPNKARAFFEIITAIKIFRC